LGSAQRHRTATAPQPHRTATAPRRRYGFAGLVAFDPAAPGGAFAPAGLVPVLSATTSDAASAAEAAGGASPRCRESTPAVPSSLSTSRSTSGLGSRG
jgi:hypothetical protein